MPAVPVIYGCETSQNEWWRFYYDPETDDWSHPQSVVSCHGNFTAGIDFSADPYLYLCRYNNFGANNQEHLSDVGGFIIEGPTNSVWYPHEGLTGAVYIDELNFWTDLGSTGGGPILRGTDLYVWGLLYPGPNLDMMKSTDSGATWASIDSSGVGPLSLASTYDEANGILYVVYKSATDKIRIISFDFATDTWSSPSSEFTASATMQDTISIHRRSNGDLVILYSAPTTKIVVYSGGVFGSEVNAQTTTDSGYSRPFRAGMDSSDILHFVYTNTDASAKDQNYYRTYSASNVLGTERAITELNSYGLNSCYFTACCPYNGTVWFAVYGPSNAPTYGTPLFKGPPNGTTALEFVITGGFAPEGIFLGLGENPCSCNAPTPPPAETKYAYIE